MQPPYSTKSNPKNRRLALGIFGVVVAFWLLLGAGLLRGWVATSIQKPAAVTSSPAKDGNLSVSTEEADIAEMIKKVSPSVVSIVTTQKSESGRWSEEALQGAGTGIIISQDGFILTNKHVINGASKVTVISSDGEQYTDVKLVGVDPLNDLAFLKIMDVKGLPAAQLGDSGTVRVGQKVVAIGNSLGQYQNTVTDGIISGKGRPVIAALDETGTDVENLSDLLQTNAAINPGNSGGPLINLAGQVIGINTAIVSGAQSVGFAIPINAAKGLVKGVLSEGRILKSYIGVRYLSITPEVRAEYKLDAKSGAYIGGASQGPSVVKNGPADKAGIREGDIILRVDGKTIGEQGGLASIVAEFLPGETVQLTILRGDEERQIDLTLGQYKS